MGNLLKYNKIVLIGYMIKIVSLENQSPVVV